MKTTWGPSVVPMTRVDPPAATSRHPKDVATQVGHQPAELIVEADDNVTPGAKQRNEAAETSEWIRGVVENTVAQDHVELLRPETGPEKVHLDEAHLSEILLAAKVLAQPQ